MIGGRISCFAARQAELQIARWALGYLSCITPENTPRTLCEKLYEEFLDDLPYGIGKTEVSRIAKWAERHVDEIRWRLVELGIGSTDPKGERKENLR